MRPFTFSLKHWHSGWHKGSLPKSLSSDNDLKPNLRYFVRILRYVAIQALFGNLWTKKVFFFGSKIVFLGQEVHFYMVYIAYFTELILQIAITRKNCKYALDENFHCHFCSRRKAAKFFHPVRYNQKKGGYRGIFREAGEDTGTYFREITDLEFQNHKNVKKKCTFCTLEQAGTNLCSMGCQTQILR